jgi:hypothetical protein
MKPSGQSSVIGVVDKEVSEAWHKTEAEVLVISTGLQLATL